MFRLHNRDEVTLVLRKEGEGGHGGRHPGAARRRDHQPEASLPPGARRQARHADQGSKGRGYVPGNLRRYGDEPTKSIGRIVLDASFSPVAASATRSKTRVEQRTDLDKLVMEIETNGAIFRRGGDHCVGQILVDQLAGVHRPGRHSAA